MVSQKTNGTFLRGVILAIGSIFIAVLGLCAKFSYDAVTKVDENTKNVFELDKSCIAHCAAQAEYEKRVLEKLTDIEKKLDELDRKMEEQRFLF